MKMSNVLQRKLHFAIPDAHGNYINNGDFSVKEELSDDTDWKFLTTLDGEAEASIDKKL